MKLFQAYSAAIKYSLVKNTDFDPYLKAYRSSGDIINLHPLADYLEEQNDPRGAILRRHIGLDEHPEQSQYQYGTGIGQSDPNYPNPNIVDAVYSPAENHNIVFSPVAKGIGLSGATAVHARYSVPGSNPKEYHHGIFTPEEARTLADKLPDEHAKRVHEMLDRHFGKRT